MSFFEWLHGPFSHRSPKSSGRAQRDRSLRIERLEDRYVLACAAAPCWLQVTLTTTDMSGNPISSIEPGGDFVLQATVSDLRVHPDGFNPDYPSTAPAGTFASYSDVTFDPSLVAVDGPASYGSLFTNGHTPDEVIFATPGQLDEIGAFADISTIFTGTPSPSLLFSVPFEASTAGEVNFVLDPADELPDHWPLLFGLTGPVPLEKIDFVDASIQVGSPNTPPIANPDAISVNAGASVTFDALADNGSGPDTDPDGDPLTITSFTQPSNGTVAQNVDGTFTYTPAAGFSGIDSFIYTIDDGQGGSDSAAVTLTVLSAPDQILLLTEQVDALVELGVLNKGNGNALNSKLQNALASLNQGNNTAAINQIEAFIDQINAFRNSGKLSTAQAQSLINAANQVIASASG